MLQALTSVAGQPGVLIPQQISTCGSLGYIANGEVLAPQQVVGTLLLNGRISDGFGMRVHPIRKRLLMHWGMDIAAPLGTPIYAIGDAVVLEATSDTAGGNCVKLSHSRVYASAYCHLMQFANGVRVGAKIRRGNVIGFVGSTGLSTGPHLHWELFVRNARVEPVCECAGELPLLSSAHGRKKQSKTVNRSLTHQGGSL